MDPRTRSFAIEEWKRRTALTVDDLYGTGPLGAKVKTEEEILDIQVKRLTEQRDALQAAREAKDNELEVSLL